MRTIFFCFLLSRMLLYSLPLDKDWKTFQSEVLKEQPHFSGWCPLEKAKHIMNLVYENHSEVCVEVGVFGGSSFYPLAATLAYLMQGKAYAIDPWNNQLCLEGNEEKGEKYQKYWGTVDLEQVMEKFIANMHRNELDSTYQIMRMTSAEAYTHFADESVDFLHIDGNHSELVSVVDVQHWLPKVKKGGIICFDDAWWESTQAAIKLLLKECDILKESSPKWQYIFLRKQK